MKKLRGQRRYYRNLQKLKNFKNNALDLSGNSNSWFDLWHIHFDWKGLGNKSWKKRKPHLDSLIKHFNSFEESLNSYPKPFHLFAIIHDYDSSDDAVYIHTSNPNQNNFPLSVEAATVSNLKNHHLQNYLDSLSSFEKIYCQSLEENYCIVFKNNIGQEFNLKLT
ncbi:hypothetical protein HUW51_18580 [Adhaeribacter swui]|uniref:Uncharacterized protein n=1 Tax=Adhaeribacter swui TaxID=2086471 RepID=A0A7G7GBV1_9BACT|nr:hypothetical protein [Adhaeribacter swui]QNF34635.1 hypothetical protein HUW51_18580 [Adhaeribacter swui]